jgi:hypothetical protein
MVIAVISLGLLVYLLTSLYFTNVSGRKSKEAELNLKRIGEIISILGDGRSYTYIFPNPSGWFLFSFTQDPKPNPCSGKKCLCICDRLWDINFWDSQVEECGEDGACLIVDNLKDSKVEIEIGSPKNLTQISIKNDGGLISIS